MDILSHIRKLYIPVQPAVNQTTENVVYEEFPPADELRNFIYCYWQLKTTRTLDNEFVYRVVADGCIDIYFELAAPHENYVMGFCKRYTEFPLDRSFNYFGIRFLPAMFPQLFKVNASDISNRFEHLSAVLPKLSSFITNNCLANEAGTVIQLLDNYFIGHLRSIQFDHDSRLYEAIKIVYENLGVINIEKDLSTGFSQRQLRRVFEYYIGDTAKTFSKVVRFQHILKAKPSLQSLRQSKLFYDSGYYDQTHFIKEFKTLYGVTPGRAFGR